MSSSDLIGAYKEGLITADDVRRVLSRLYDLEFQQPAPAPAVTPGPPDLPTEATPEPAANGSRQWTYDAWIELMRSHYDDPFKGSSVWLESKPFGSFTDEQLSAIAEKFSAWKSKAAPQVSRQPAGAGEDVSTCYACGAPGNERTSAHGPFWTCSKNCGFMTREGKYITSTWDANNRAEKQRKMRQRR